MQHISEAPGIETTVSWQDLGNARFTLNFHYKVGTLQEKDPQTEDLQLFQLRDWKHSRALLIFLNEVISLIFGPWSKISLGFGNSSLFSLQQRLEKN